MYDPFDVWQSNKEEAYKARIEGRTCFDCANCSKPDHPFDHLIGWCVMLEGFVYISDNPRDAECWSFE